MKTMKLTLSVLMLAAGLSACNEDIFTDFNGDGIPDMVDGYNLVEVADAANATVYLPDARTLDVCLNEPYALTAGQHIDAGSVEVVNDGTYLYVTYNTAGTFGTLHLWVGTSLLNVPSVLNGPNAGTPVPGRFPFSFDATGLQHHTFVIPLAAYNYMCGTSLYFIAHAEVSGDMNGDGTSDGTQTAFGGNTGVDVDSPGRWYFYDTYTIQCCTFKTDENPTIKRVETAYAKPPVSDLPGNKGYVFVGSSSKKNSSNPEKYYTLGLTQNRWGWVANIRANGTYTYEIWAGAGLNNTANGTNVGTATVSYDGTTLTVNYNLSGAVLEEVHIYANDLMLSTIAPGQYGYTKYFETPFTVNSFSESFNVTDSNSDGIWVCLHAVAGIF